MAEHYLCFYYCMISKCTSHAILQPNLFYWTSRNIWQEIVFPYFIFAEDVTLPPGRGGTRLWTYWHQGSNPGAALCIGSFKPWRCSALASVFLMKQCLALMVNSRTHNWSCVSLWSSSHRHCQPVLCYLDLWGEWCIIAKHLFTQEATHSLPGFLLACLRTRPQEEHHTV